MAINSDFISPTILFQGLSPFNLNTLFMNIYLKIFYTLMNFEPEVHKNKLCFAEKYSQFELEI